MIPVCVPYLVGSELAYVTDCLETGWVSSEGSYVGAFEAAVALSCGKAFGVAVNSGTAALDVAIGCLQLQPGDEVIMPTFTIISCAQAVTRAGAIPVLVDSDPRTWCMDVSQVEARVTPRTRAIMAVHIYGHPVDMDPIRQIARSHNLKIIEDAAEAQGGEYKGQPCGGLGDLGCFSFYANKLITTGEGGMVVTDDPGLAARARLLRNLAFQTERRFLHEELGDNYRMTNVQAAIGLAQMESFAERVRRKQAMGRHYTERLQGLASLQLPIQESWASHVYWMYGVVIDEATGLDATEFARRLHDLGVDTRPFFLGMHEQPALHALGLFDGEHFPVAERIARQGLYLPSSIGIDAHELDLVCDAVREILG